MSPHVPSDRDIMVMIIYVKERPPTRVAAFFGARKRDDGKNHQDNSGTAQAGAQVFRQ